MHAAAVARGVALLPEAVCHLQPMGFSRTPRAAAPQLAHIHVLGDMQHKHPGQDGDKAAQLAQHLLYGLVLVVLEHNAGGGDGEGGEHDVVDGGDHGGVEHVQRLVEVVHLRHHAHQHHRRAHPRLRVYQLVAALKREFDGDAQRLTAHHRQAADERADADGHEDLRAAVGGRHVDAQHARQRHAEGGVRREPRLQGHHPQLLHAVHRALLGRVQHDGDGPHYTQQTPQPSKHVQFLAEQVVRHHRADDDGQGAQWGHEDGGGEGVGSKVGDLSDDHAHHAHPPQRLLQVPIPAAARAHPAAARLLEPLFFNDETRADANRRGHRQHQPLVRVR
mmetsp:Transcript_16901/g.41523  ORF Transcript_16901/g.41523 Transcript_16901/m.41523 type:complete len:334 (-) Transcript_16901:174-1175(-)